MTRAKAFVPDAMVRRFAGLNSGFLDFGEFFFQ
jgi:hypothetical protein